MCPLQTASSTHMWRTQTPCVSFPFPCSSVALLCSIQFLRRARIHACIHNPRNSLSIISFSAGKRRRGAATSDDKNTHSRPESDIICVHFGPRYVRPESDRNPSTRPLPRTRAIRPMLDIRADEWDAASRRAIGRVIIFSLLFALIRWELCEQMLLSPCLRRHPLLCRSQGFHSRSARSPLSTTPNMVKKRLQFPASK